MLRTILLNITFFIWMLFMTPFVFIGLINERLLRVVAKIIVVGLFAMARIIGGIKWKVHNARYAFVALNKKPIIASKHMSLLETGFLVAYIPNSTFIIKRELMWIPIYGWAFWRLGMVPVNRKPGATNMNKLVVSAKSAIEKGRNLIIFPEGTRVKPGEGVRVRGGILHLARALDMPILPVGTDAGLYWPKRGAVKPGTANIYFEELLPANATADEIATAIGRHSA